MPKVTLFNRKFDARPDRIDYRDREYRPPLVSLPECYPHPEEISQKFGDYSNNNLILDQGSEGACTGFGLAAVINYLLWRNSLDTEIPMQKVSMRMLYQLAKVYDEWEGEDYEGSSCRGAMKGWHRHGVCSDQIWSYKKSFSAPKKGWQQEAARCPLGAYYRINKNSLMEMQSAIHEVGAIYVSGNVHAGWDLKKSKTLPTIQIKSGPSGGHAFAIVGYTPQGFIVQNSWGVKWGYGGFAILTYMDWVHNGTDAWVATLGAPMVVDNYQPRTRSSMSLRDSIDGKALWFGFGDDDSDKYVYKNPNAKPITETLALEHTIILGNNGRPINRFIDKPDAKSAVKETAFNLPVQALKGVNAPKIAIYAHGGLNNEEDSIKRIRVMAPYFWHNGVYPLFITWRTGLGESIANIMKDKFLHLFRDDDTERSQGFFSDAFKKAKNVIKDSKDRSVEWMCENVLVKPVWMQMKQNAEAGISSEGGIAMLANHLKALNDQIQNLQIHLIGHSAGSILLGHLLGKLATKKLKVSTLSLYAPACTVKFANKHYIKAIKNKLMSWNNLHLDILDDEREEADSVGPYGKSLLYLVSRALEMVHKTPILGMEAVWKRDGQSEDRWHDDTLNDIDTWLKTVKDKIPMRVHKKKRELVSNGKEMIPLSHGSFDNDIDVVTKTLHRILGDTALNMKVENLAGF